MWPRDGCAVRGISQDPNKPILGDRTRRPPVLMMVLESIVREIVVDVIRIEEGDQQVDVQ